MFMVDDIVISHTSSFHYSKWVTIITILDYLITERFYSSEYDLYPDLFTVL